MGGTCENPLDWDSDDFDVFEDNGLTKARSGLYLINPYKSIMYCSIRNRNCIADSTSIIKKYIVDWTIHNIFLLITDCSNCNNKK